MMKRTFLSAALFVTLASVACSSADAVANGGEPVSGAETPAIEAPKDDGNGSAPGPSTSEPTKPAPACDVLTPRTKPLELFVQPDVGSAPFVAAITKATKTIDVMVYQMGYGPILDGLEAKAKAGVTVRVILDLSQKNVNQKYMDRLLAAGANVIWSDPQFTYMHAKVILVDGAEAIISTGNYSESYMGKERNFAVRNTDPADIEVLTKLYAADFSRTAPDLTCTRLIVAPVNAKQRLIDFIASAKKEIVIESMQLGDKDIRDAIAARKAAGVAVRALLADPSWIDTNKDAGTFLAEKQIPARWMKSPGVHVKAIVVDDQAAYIGSENLSWTSLTKNREVGLIVSEAANAATVKSTFETDWATATPF